MLGILQFPMLLLHDILSLESVRHHGAEGQEGHYTWRHKKVRERQTCRGMGEEHWGVLLGKIGGYNMGLERANRQGGYEGGGSSGDGATIPDPIPPQEQSPHPLLS